ncbi:PREDICTED: epithelial chloride channel protein-like [Nanorana parkeri]|uniref:epithelial chloride channel protein-like n=1 Tax=Nanorana parkeri TaxID=125878 RepID=UPI000853F5C3|nr:PREDICTED: epithelial chloride channel protein-like [Nanorana parkeri]
MRILEVLTFISVLQTSCSAEDSTVRLKDNGYEDIVIAINPKIPEDARIIEKIKDMVNGASTYMLQATKQRLFIRSVKVLIPNSWSTNSSYERPKRESYDKADIIIADPFIHGDFPYTLQYGGCGVKGKYIHLTPNFMLNDKILDIYGPRGRVFVHEWAHLRWGVFDEYNNDIPFYIGKQGQVEATRCPLAMSGLSRIEVCYNDKCVKENCNIDPKTGVYEEGCEFYPNKDQGIHESIMYSQTLDPVNAFCDENSHNKEAPNEQNRLCNYQSTWEVIMKSPDMTSSAPLTNPSVVPPSISLLQFKDRVVTLVLDISGSMNEHKRISRMYQASEVYIMQIVESGSYVGIVTFSSSATVQSELVKIVDTFQREKLKNFLPKTAVGGTNICAGVRKGFEVNKKNDGSTHGTEIVLLTDGEDKAIHSCLNEVGASEAIIHTVALGVSADKGLEQLSSITGGLNYFVSDYIDANGFIDAFSKITTSSGDFTENSQQIESTATTINAFKCLTGEVTIDNTVGNETFFLVTWESGIPTISLTDPKGKVYDTNQFVSDLASKSARLTIPGTAEKGQWEYKICNNEVAAQVLGLTVNSRASDSKVPPIVVEPYLNADTSRFPNPVIVYATVTQGFSPVLGLNVTAIIEPENGKIRTLQLEDNGAGADIIKNDGIYSRYFIDFTGNGRYGLKVRVESKSKNAKLAQSKHQALYLPGYVENGIIISNPPKPKVTTDNLTLGEFTRTASGGAFIVTEVPSGPLPDVFKPGKIMSLSATFQGQQVLLSWTATGDDLDQGNASRYDLRMSHNREELLYNFENGTVVDTSDLIPLAAGTMEQFNFTPQNITIKNGTALYFALVAIDKVNQRSEPSNLAKALSYIPPAPNAANDISQTGAMLSLILLALLFATYVL